MPVSYLNFVEERLELGHDYGAVGGRGFKTEIITNGAESEQRNGLWWLALGRWQLGERMLLDGDVSHIDEVAYLRDFHAARLGSVQGFRFKDWTDYRGVNQPLINGVEAEGSSWSYQLTKAYRVGTSRYLRPILKPVPGTVAVYLNGVAIFDFSVDYAKGIITVNALPGDSGVLTCDFEFDIPVRFEKDSIDWKLEAVKLKTGETLHRLGSVFVKEIKIKPDLNWTLDSVPQVLANPLELGIILDSSQDYFFSTKSEALASGYESRDRNQNNSRSLLKLATKNFNRQELDRILDHFYVARGRLICFFLSLNSQLYLCRFNSDALSIKYLYKDGLYQISNLDFYVFGDLSFIDNETYIKAFVDSSGSMDGEIPAVTEAIATLRDLLLVTVYRDEATLNKYFKGSSLYDSERWVQWMSEDLRDSTGEPNKQIYLIWLNESVPTYHNGTDNNGEPTAFYNADLANFLATYAERENFKAIIYSVAGELAAITYFQNHLINAIEGTNGYDPALQDYKVSAKIDIPPGRPPEEYLKDIFSS